MGFDLPWCVPNLVLLPGIIWYDCQIIMFQNFSQNLLTLLIQLQIGTIGHFLSDSNKSDIILKVL